MDGELNTSGVLVLVLGVRERLRRKSLGVSIVLLRRVAWYCSMGGCGEADLGRCNPGTREWLE